MFAFFSYAINTQPQTSRETISKLLDRLDDPVVFVANCPVSLNRLFNNHSNHNSNNTSFHNWNNNRTRQLIPTTLPHEASNSIPSVSTQILGPSNNSLCNSSNNNKAVLLEVWVPM